MRPPHVSDQAPVPKHQIFPNQRLNSGTSCNRPRPLLGANGTTSRMVRSQRSLYVLCYLSIRRTFNDNMELAYRNLENARRKFSSKKCTCPDPFSEETHCASILVLKSDHLNFAFWVVAHGSRDFR